jgi:hypothetical protein
VKLSRPRWSLRRLNRWLERAAVVGAASDVADPRGSERAMETQIGLGELTREQEPDE